MVTLPNVVIESWNNREDAVVFTTVDNNGTPNSVYVSCIKREGDSSFVIADNYFSKTRDNIECGKKVSILFITKNRKSFQIKGTVKRFTSGEEFEEMKRWLDPKYPGSGAVVVTVQEVYKGSDKLV